MFLNETNVYGHILNFSPSPSYIKEFLDKFLLLKIVICYYAWTK